MARQPYRSASAGADIFREGFDKLEPLLASILAAADTDDTREMAVAAQGMAKAAEILGRHYILVATNVPYLVRGKQGDVIRAYAEVYCPNGASRPCHRFHPTVRRVRCRYGNPRDSFSSELALPALVQSLPKKTASAPVRQLHNQSWLRGHFDG